MLGFLSQLGYDNYLRRTGTPPSSEAEAAYKAETEQNVRRAKTEEARRKQERAEHLASLPVTPRPFMKAGRLRENTRSGSVVHLVMSNGEDGGHDSAYPRAALCGDAPAIGWSGADGQEVTCTKCRKRLSIS